MPGGTDFECTACGGTTTFAQGFHSYRKPSGELVPLPHPHEDDAARDLGTTLGRAARRGRLWASFQWVCPTCGGVAGELRRRAPGPRLSDVVAFWIVAGPAIVVFALGTFASDLRIHLPEPLRPSFWRVTLPTLAGVWVLTAAARAVERAYLVRAHGPDGWPAPPHHCESCGAAGVKDARDLTAEEIGRIRCGLCGRHGLQRRNVWIS